MTPTVRTLLTSFLIAAVAPVGMAVLDLETPAFAKNGGGNGHGGGNGNGHGGDQGNSGNHSNGGQGNAKNADTADSVAGADDTTDDGMAPNELGKLNGILHANPNAIAHASAKSPKGIARAFGEALGGFLGQAPADPAADPATDPATDPVTIDQLGEMMANMTNKPVTAAQVEAVAEKLGIETETTDPTTTDQTATDQTTTDQPTDTTEAPKLDEATAQAIADKANEIHAGETTDDTADTGDTTDGDTTDGDTTDGGDTADTGETVTN